LDEKDALDLQLAKQGESLFIESAPDTTSPMCGAYGDALEIPDASSWAFASAREPLQRNSILQRELTERQELGNGEPSDAAVDFCDVRNAVFSLEEAPKPYPIVRIPCEGLKFDGRQWIEIFEGSRANDDAALGSSARLHP
jgi:hypothetical protein